jgi:hypothetical protein
MSVAPTTSTGTRTTQQAAQSLYGDVQSTATAIERGDWLSAGIGVSKVALDVIAVSGDPMGAISSAGFGFLISHIKFLREPFDKLLGDPNSIVSSSQGWGGASTDLSASANRYREAVRSETTSWSGSAANGYRSASETQAHNLDSLAQISKAVSDAIAGAGQALAEIRKAVIDLINQACNKIIMIMIEALAEAWGSFGASIAKGIAQSVTTAVQHAAQMLQKVQKLIQTFQKILQLIQKVMQLVQAVKQLLDQVGGKASGNQTTTMSGTALGYNGAISAGTGPQGTSGTVDLQSLAPTQNYNYANYTPGQTTNPTLAQLSPTQNYNYQGYTPGVQVAQANTGATSQNGWPVDPPRGMRTVPGTNVRVNVANGPAGDVLTYVLSQVDQRVQRLDPNATWGYAHREIRGGTALSNHASATAVDMNSDQHPLGARGTFTQDQVDQIHQIVAETNGVVRWGGDYRGRADEMHFEIVGTPEEVQAAADRIRLIQERTP